MPVGTRAASVLLAVSLLWVGWSPGWAADPPLGGARTSAVEGEVLVQLEEGGGWRPAPLHMPLLPGDRLQVGPSGRLEILLSNGAAIRLGPASAARFVAVPPSEPEGEPAELDLEAGRAILATGEGEPSRPAAILNAAGARILVSPRSRVRAETIAADAIEVALRDGAAAVETPGASIPLRAGETVEVSRGSARLAAARPPDAFEGWSDARDRALAEPPPPSAAAAPPLPAPLAPQAADLTRYGQWTTVPDDGPVWRPTAIPAGWAPFTTGRWTWRGGTWVWLPAEAWGWVPFHYGRWRWDPFLGWYWVPPRPRAIVWCPGAVAWFRTPAHVAWLPLAPGEIYYAPRPYGLWSAVVPRTTVISITHITIRKTFVNAAAPAAVAAVPAASLARPTAVSPVPTRVNLAAVAGGRSVALVTPAALAPAGGAVRPLSATSPAPGAAPAGRIAHQARPAISGQGGSAPIPTHPAATPAAGPQAGMPQPAHQAWDARASQPPHHPERRERQIERAPGPGPVRSGAPAPAPEGPPPRQDGQRDRPGRDHRSAAADRWNAREARSSAAAQVDQIPNRPHQPAGAHPAARQDPGAAFHHAPPPARTERHAQRARKGAAENPARPHPAKRP